MFPRINPPLRQRHISAAVQTAMIAMLAITITLTGLMTTPTTRIAIALPAPTTVPTTAAPTAMATLPSAPFEEQPAILVSPRAGAPIALYIRPAPNQQPVGYGISGESVTITDQFGDYLMEDTPSATWSHIRLNDAPYTEGWLRGQFLSIEAPQVAPEPTQ